MLLLSMWVFALAVGAVPNVKDDTTTVTPELQQLGIPIESY